MESYNNYQDIINAIKAEYVIVRDLKRTANAKKRELNNAHSFVNRKGNEEDTLDIRLENAKQAALSRAANSLENIKSAIASDYTLYLSASAAKLAFIEAEILKLQNFSISLPEQYDAFTQNELNSIDSLKGVLVSAINDTKFIYENDIIESSKFSALKDETKLSTETSRDNDIRAYYDTIVYNVKQLIESTRQHFAEYVSTSLSLENSLRVTKDELVNTTRALVFAKSELADLLDSNAPQSQIDAKNNEIDTLKIKAKEEAAELKALDIETEMFYTNKHKDFSVYFEVIHSLYEEVQNWLYTADAQIFITYEARDYRRDIQMYIRKFMEELITSIGEKIPTVNGQSLSQIIRQEFESTSYDVMNGDQAIMNSDRKIQLLSNLEGYSDYDSQSGKITLSTDVPGRVWYDSLYYLRQLHQRAQGYMDAKKHLQVKRSQFFSRLSIFDEGFSQAFNTYIPAFANAYSDSRFREFEYLSKMEGVWTGTPEQENAYLDLINQRRNILTNLTVEGYQKDLYTLRLSLFSGMFPSFYSEETELKNAKESTLAALNSINATMDDMSIAKQAAYDYLQTLTETDEEYQAAFTAWNNANTEYQSLLAAYDALTPQFELLNNNLTDATNLVNNSLPGSINSTFVYGTGFSGVVYATAIQSDGKILVGGQFSSYKGTDAYNIIRLNADGSVDTSFVTGYGVQGQVNSIVIQPDGKILVAGNLYQYNESPVENIIRLNSDGSLDTSFYLQGTGFNGPVKSIAMVDEVTIIAIGNFTQYNGIAANGIVKLFTSGKPQDIGSIFADFFTGTGFGSPYLVPEMESIVIQSNGKILVGGAFTSYNGTATKGIVRLNSNGVLDTSFVISTFLQYVTTIAIQSDGKIVVGGSFTKYNPDKDENGEWIENTGTRVNNILRLNTDGSLDTSFYPTSQTDFPAIKGFSGTVWSIVIQSDDKIVVGGQFEQYCASWVEKIVRLNADGSVDTSFVTGSGIQGGYVRNISIKSNNTIFLGGQFSSYKGTSANGIIQLNLGGGDAEAALIAATNALNAFQTDIRIPASNAKNAAEIVVNETYDILQPLTEIDEEYAAAFNDWNSKEIAFDEFDLNIKAPAIIAADNALADYNYHISVENVYDAVSSFSLNGSGLMTIKSEADEAVTQYEVSQSQLSETSTSLEAIKGEMTFVESDLATMLEAYGYIDDENTTAYKASSYWSSLLDSNYATLSNLTGIVINSYNLVSNHSPYEEDALQQIKDFLDGNTEYSTNRDLQYFGESIIFRADHKSNFSGNVLRHMFNMSENDFSNYFRPDTSTTNAFKDNPTFLSDKLRSIAQSYRGRANAGFADQVINFVNTGVANF